MEHPLANRLLRYPRGHIDLTPEPSLLLPRGEDVGLLRVLGHSLQTLFENPVGFIL